MRRATAHSSESSLEFQLELVMVHLEQMNKRLDMLEKTCMALIEKRLGVEQPQTSAPTANAGPEVLCEKKNLQAASLRRGSIA